MGKRKQDDRIGKSEVFDMMKEAGLIKDARYDMGELSHGTLTFAGEIVGFQGELGFYSRKEVNRFIADYRMTQKG